MEGKHAVHNLPQAYFLIFETHFSCFDLGYAQPRLRRIVYHRKQSEDTTLLDVLSTRTVFQVREAEDKDLITLE